MTHPGQKTITCHCTCPDCWHGCCHIPLDDLDELYKRRDLAEAALDRVRALRDQWLLMTLEPGQVRRLLDGITHIIDGEQP